MSLPHMISSKNNVLSLQLLPIGTGRKPWFYREVPLAVLECLNILGTQVGPEQTDYPLRMEVLDKDTQMN